MVDAQITQLFAIHHWASLQSVLLTLMKPSQWVLTLLQEHTQSAQTLGVQEEAECPAAAVSVVEGPSPHPWALVDSKQSTALAPR